MSTELLELARLAGEVGGEAWVAAVRHTRIAAIGDLIAIGAAISVFMGTITWIWRPKPAWSEIAKEDLPGIRIAITCAGVFLSTLIFALGFSPTLAAALEPAGATVKALLGAG